MNCLDHTVQRECDRCGVAERDTMEGYLAGHGHRLVCADCDDALNDEWVAENGGTHPVDALNPCAGLAVSS